HVPGAGLPDTRPGGVEPGQPHRALQPRDAEHRAAQAAPPLAAQHAGAPAPDVPAVTRAPPRSGWEEQVKALRFAALCIVIGVLPACSHHQKTVDMGLKRITLDLAFKNAATSAKPTITQFVLLQEPVGAPSQLLSDLVRPVLSSSAA